jgi:hypothetical protein
MQDVNKYIHGSNLFYTGRLSDLELNDIKKMGDIIIDVYTDRIVVLAKSNEDLEKSKTDILQKYWQKLKAMC